MHVRSCWDDAHFSLNDQYLLDSRNGMCQKLIAVKSEIYTRCVNPQVHYVYFPFSKNISNHKVIHIQTRSHIRTHTHIQTHTHTHTNFDKSIHNSPHPDDPPTNPHCLPNLTRRCQDFDMFTTATT